MFYDFTIILKSAFSFSRRNFFGASLETWRGADIESLVNAVDGVQYFVNRNPPPPQLEYISYITAGQLWA
jgi:hypothetical protein